MEQIAIGGSRDSVSSRLIELHMLQPFQWGVSDCCLAVCNILVDMGYPDAAASYRNRYTTREGALKVMQGSAEDVAERECARLGWPEISPDDARTCDVGVMANSLAIYSGGRWAAKTENGMVLRGKVRRAWRPAK